MHTYNGVLTILGLACFLYFVFRVSVKIKLTVPLLRLCAFCLKRPSLKWPTVKLLIVAPSFY